LYFPNQSNFEYWKILFLIVDWASPPEQSGPRSQNGLRPAYQNSPHRTVNACASARCCRTTLPFPTGAHHHLERTQRVLPHRPYPLNVVAKSKPISFLPCCFVPLQLALPSPRSHRRVITAQPSASPTLSTTDVIILGRHKASPSSPVLEPLSATS
jgi:hypothetical protein